MWERARIVEALNFIKANGLTGLVLHETDFVHHVVYPRDYFDPYALWKDAPSRRGENAIFNNRIYFDHVLQLARKAGVEVYVEVKEIGFSDEVLEYKPALIKNGAVCPSEPFWFEYIERKTEELLSDFPLLAGMIVSAGSQESRASRAQNKCKCELCAAISVPQWYRRIAEALYRPAHRHGKRLAIRDFAYKPADHEPLIESMNGLPGDVIFSIKAMPHDFYATFPPNPAIGRLQRPQWLEYDVLGQFFGWGVFPCFMLDDIRARLAHAEQNGVSGATFRTEWERINDLSSFDNLNHLNLIAAAALARGEAVDAAMVCRRGLGLSEAGARWMAETLALTWPVVKRAAYMNDFVFADNSMLPRSIKRAWWGMEARDGLAMWDESRAHDLELDRAKLTALLAEKDEALRLARDLVARVQAGDASLSPAQSATLRAQFDHYDLWVEGLRLAGHVCLYARWFTTGAVNAADRAAFAAALDDYESYGRRVRALAVEAEVPHQKVMMIDYRRVADVVREGRAVFSTLVSS